MNKQLLKHKVSLKSMLLLFMAVMLSIPAFSQPGQGRRHQERMRVIETRRIAFITEYMDLTPDEAKMLWPIYNEYNNKVQALQDNFRERSDEMPEASEMTEEQAALYIEKEIHRFEKMAEIKRELHENLKEVLPVQKVALLYEAERRFNRMLFRESQQRGRERRERK